MSTKQQFLIDNTDSIQQQAFNTESTLYNCQVAQTTTPAYDIEVHKLNLPTPGHGTYYSEHHCFLEYVIHVVPITAPLAN